MKINKTLCFICGSDITNLTKVLTYHNFPYHYWNELGPKKGWNKLLPKLFNGALCTKCAQKDLETAHMILREPHIRENERLFIVTRIKQQWLGRLLLRFVKLDYDIKKNTAYQPVEENSS